MNKNIFKLSMLAAVVGVLASCEIHFGPNDSANSNSNNYNISRNSVSKLEGEGFEVVNPKYTMRQNSENQGWNTLNSTGTQKMLIVPVHLSGESETWTNKKLSDIEKAFFGKASETSWHSVSSYFDESSYGNLHLIGEVAPVFESSYSESDLLSYASKTKNPPCSDFIASEYSTSTSLSNEKRKEYDQDGDGYIDATIFIYLPKPINSPTNSNTDAFWAWCYANTNNLASTSKPVVNNYMWASYDFINDSYVKTELFETLPSGIEAHTYIHETGHLLGLDDYYCYDEYKIWNCAGDRDMQAFNIGDHNIYSKMALGWVSPYYVTGDCEIKLHSSSLYGEAIVIRDEWNKTIFDEYLIIEYYTPEGLNYQDSKHSYDYRNKMYQGSGLRIYHVDARLIDFSKRTYDGGYSYSSESKYTSNTIIGASNSIVHSNLTTKQSKNNKIRYLHLLDSGKRNTISHGINGTGDYDTSSNSGNEGVKIDPNKTLWTKGQVFTADSDFFVNGTKFNNGYSVNYSITVGDTDGDTITVKISKTN